MFMAACTRQGGALIGQARHTRRNVETGGRCGRRGEGGDAVWTGVGVEGREAGDWIQEIQRQESWKFVKENMLLIKYGCMGRRTECELR